MTAGDTEFLNTVGESLRNSTPHKHHTLHLAHIRMQYFPNQASVNLSLHAAQVGMAPMLQSLPELFKLLPLFYLAFPTETLKKWFLPGLFPSS